ncbi:hypothetical protein KBY74_10445 [Cyanobium sp. A1C-AMD]|uniref:hypothetical protein n=1 Tax=Cyanobium sp. A1C-AMD TaxID=2823694 RepID=UPI0020CC0918|nr:hypothetical protein [Cyanobium sp. A1C-AMD]MCP9880268.1 hypothetical protein [Cyanobium sp. A1C-AMD]
MSTSPSSAPSPSISKSEYYSSLPWFRRCLAMLNWRPVVDYELREIEFDRREIEFEKRKIVHEQRMSQLESEDAQLRKDDEQRKIEHERRMKQLKSENERLAELNAKLSAILCSSATSSNPTNPMPNESEM